MNLRPLFLFILIIFMMTACHNKIDEEINKDLTIYTSIYPLQFITEEIAGKHAKVESIFPPGVDAHSYEPTIRDITKIANGDLFIFMGENMEGFAEATTQALKAQNIVFIDISEQEQLFINSKGHNDHTDLDPHIWLDPLRLADLALVIKNELSELAPCFKQTFAKNFSVLQSSLHELDQTFNEILKDKTNKYILVAHPAYGYWGDRYDIKQIPISRISSGYEPSQKELADIVRLALEKKIQHVVFEPNNPDRIATIIQNYLEGEAVEIHNLEVLTDQDLNNHENYFTLMRKNLEVLDQITN